MAEVRIQKGRLKKGPFILLGLFVMGTLALGLVAAWDRIAEALPKGNTRIVTTIYQADRTELKVQKLIPRRRRTDPRKILETFGGAKPEKGGKMSFSRDMWCRTQLDPSKGKYGTTTQCKDLNEASTLEKLQLRQRLLDTEGVKPADLPPALQREGG